LLFHASQLFIDTLLANHLARKAALRSAIATGGTGVQGGTP